MGSSPAALLGVLEAAQDLKQVPRMGWLLAGVSAPESVAEHSFGVAMWTLLLGTEINENSSGVGTIQVDRAVRLALIHDLAESVLTDLPKRSAQLIGAERKHAAERVAMTRLLGPLADGDSLQILWKEYDAADTPEARLVKDADTLEMVHQALRYEERGQRNLGEFWAGHRWNFAASRALFEELCRLRSELTGKAFG